MSARNRKRSPRRRATGHAAPRILPFDSRQRIATALARCTREERVVLALLLFERLTPPEAADVLGVSPRRLERIYGGLLHELDASLEGTPSRRRRRARDIEVPLPLRKAS